MEYINFVMDLIMYKNLGTFGDIRPCIYIYIHTYIYKEIYVNMCTYSMCIFSLYYYICIMHYKCVCNVHWE